jgi:hypothetical protein
MATQNKPSGISRLEKQVKAGSELSKEANEDSIANNGELMVAIIAAITAYIQTEQQPSSNADDKGTD